MYPLLHLSADILKKGALGAILIVSEFSQKVCLSKQKGEPWETRFTRDVASNASAFY